MTMLSLRPFNSIILASNTDKCFDFSPPYCKPAENINTSYWTKVGLEMDLHLITKIELEKCILTQPEPLHLLKQSDIHMKSTNGKSKTMHVGYYTDFGKFDQQES